MATQLNDITLVINDEQVAYSADTLRWKDGFGDYTTRNAVLGGGQTQKILSKDLATKKGMVAFSMPSIDANEKNKVAWKLNDDNNTIELIGPRGSGFTKNFTNAVVLGDPETNAGTDGNIEVEFETDPAQ